ncbi:DNA polymerase III subunit delta' [Neiella marina]|uniref:DNA polymerase III subunit delta' n=1 Tax=Neiella holothuriorum TaxID=2870530 RepID=A0ABS7EK55_9GAMM|nr:DNA polymerase III subunit delta' [Neiella holothuriorum]MBW8192605.1 DNA polymerase III subunit delta' [Neiella holothuriorum]
MVKATDEQPAISFDISQLPWLSGSQQRLLDQIAQQRLPHAMLFTGTEGTGKSQLTHWLAHRLLCASPTSLGACGQCRSCLLVRAGSHPDFLNLQTEGASIGVDIVRKAIATLSETAHQQGARVVLIEHAEIMTEAAANALLKTLEEPGQNAFLLLSAANAGQLVATITSRCQEHLVAVPNEQVALDWLAEQGSAATLAHLRLNGGAPLLARSFVESGLHHQLDAFLVRLFAVLQGDSISNELLADAVDDFPHSYHWLSSLLLDLQKVTLGLTPEHLMFSQHWTELNALAQQLHHQCPDWSPWLANWRQTLGAQGLNQNLQWQAMLLSLQQLLQQPNRPLIAPNRSL